MFLWNPKGSQLCYRNCTRFCYLNYYLILVCSSGTMFCFFLPGGCLGSHILVFTVPVWIFQHCQCSETDIQLLIYSSACNLQLTWSKHSILYINSCAGLLQNVAYTDLCCHYWNVLTINYLYSIHCLLSIDAQQISMNVICMEEFNNTLLLHIHVTCYFT